MSKKITRGKFVLGAKGLTIADVQRLSMGNTELVMDKRALSRMIASHAWLKKKVDQDSESIYGVNTGFGSNAKYRIPVKEQSALQRNLLISHACGVDVPLAPQLVRAMLVLRIQNMTHGYSGVNVATVQRMIDMYNADVLPIIPRRGSLGASGDLAPLAHLALPLINEGEVWYKGARTPSKEVNDALGWMPLQLDAKEGLALINGTQFMNAHAALLVAKAQRLADWADVLAAMSLEAFAGSPSPFYAGIHAVRKQEGQAKVAARMRALLKGGTVEAKGLEGKVQDPYCFRCVPQVHGASRDAIDHVKRIVQRELAAVTDNPIVFHEAVRAKGGKGMVLSGGNFHGQPLALSLDFLAIALAEFGSISERRTYKLMDGEKFGRPLPAYLAFPPKGTTKGLHSGFMIVQYTAAALVSANKQRCTPSSIDSIDSSNGQEDHVSMGANAALKCWELIEDVERILGLELLSAVQALRIRQKKWRPAITSENQGARAEAMAWKGMAATLVNVERALDTEGVELVTHDVVMYERMEMAIEFLRKYEAPRVG